MSQFMSAPFKSKETTSHPISLLTFPTEWVPEKSSLFPLSGFLKKVPKFSFLYEEKKTSDWRARFFFIVLGSTKYSPDSLEHPPKKEDGTPIPYTVDCPLEGYRADLGKFYHIFPA